MKTIALKLTENIAIWWQRIHQSRVWPIGWGLLTTSLLFKESGRLLRMLDSTAAPIDLGILSILPLTVFCLLLFLVLCMGLLQLVLPNLSLSEDRYFVSQFNLLPPWQQFKLYLGSFFALLFSCVLVLAALL